MSEATLQASLADANQLLTTGEFQQARILLLETTTRYPDSAEAWKDLGICENKLGNFEAAERYLQTALELDETDADARSSLGGVYVSLGRYEQALACYADNLERNHADTYALLNYLTMKSIVAPGEASLDAYRKALDAGRALCEAQIAAGENLPWCYYDLAQIFFFEGHGKQFSECLVRALQASVQWQVVSAKRTYELLTLSSRLSEPAQAALDEFDSHGE